jgi:hypothetical protein
MDILHQRQQREICDQRECPRLWAMLPKLPQVPLLQFPAVKSHPQTVKYIQNSPLHSRTIQVLGYVGNLYTSKHDKTSKRPKN